MKMFCRDHEVTDVSMFQSELLSSSEGKTAAVSTPWEHSVASCPADQLTPEGGKILWHSFC